jgi:hypothetical protein
MELEEKARCVLREGETTSRHFSLGKIIQTVYSVTLI